MVCQATARPASGAVGCRPPPARTRGRHSPRCSLQVAAARSLRTTYRLDQGQPSRRSVSFVPIGSSDLSFSPARRSMNPSRSLHRFRRRFFDPAEMPNQPPPNRVMIFLLLLAMSPRRPGRIGVRSHRAVVEVGRTDPQEGNRRGSSACCELSPQRPLARIRPRIEKRIRSMTPAATNSSMKPPRPPCIAWDSTRTMKLRRDDQETKLPNANGSASLASRDNRRRVGNRFSM